MLVTMFIFLTILYLIKWYKKPSYKNTIILAFSVALTALSKISGTAIAIPIIYIFLVRFVRDVKKQFKLRNIENNKIKQNNETIMVQNKCEYKYNLKSYIIKFVIFGVIALGLGLSFSIRNLISYGQSIFYVPVPGLTSRADKSLAERLTLFSDEWINLYCEIDGDWNIFAYLIKSSLFGEWAVEGSITDFISSILTICSWLIILISLISIVKIISRNCKRNRFIKNMFLIYYIELILMFVWNNLKYPFSCTMDIRYIVPTILIGMLFIVINMMEESEKTSVKENGMEACRKKKYSITNISIFIFSMFSIVYELTYLNMLQ